jgi:PAS domain S-box-containing protein
MKLENLYFDASSELLIILNSEYKIENANKAFLDIIGNPKENIVGLSILTFISTDEATATEKFLANARTGEKQVFKWKTNEKEAKELRFKMSLKNSDGIILKIEDPGALNNKWGKKIVNEQILQLLFNLVPYPLFVKNSLSEYVLLNQAQADLFGLTMSEMIGKSDEAFIKDPKELELVQKSDKEVLDSFKKTILPDQQITTPDGKMYILETNKLPFTNDVSGETNILGVSIDNTERKLAEAKLKAA